MKRWTMVLMVFAFLVAERDVWAQIVVEGHVYEQDGVIPIEAATVTFSGINTSGDTLVYQFTTDSLGHYNNSVTAGTYRIWASAEGYASEFLADSLPIMGGQMQNAIDFSLHELFFPVRYVAARQYTSNLARISWSMHEPLLVENFETGDFSRFPWNNNLSDYPWTIDTLHAYEGNSCMKSTCDGIGGGISQIEVSVYVPLEGQMSFYSKISSESPWDIGCFFLDGIKKIECSGEEDWTEHRFDISVGEHVFRWNYVKDASTDVGDDCFYVDCIRFYQEDSTKATRSFQYYDLFRSRFEESPVLMASHLTDTVFMDMNWSSLPWGKYKWGVSCHYEGNRGDSDTIWSAYLDKDMTTTFVLNATTNVGQSPVGAIVTLSSHDGQNHEYQASLDANGHLLLPTIYRDAYDLSVHLDGFADYVSNSAISIFEPTQIEVELMEATNGIDSLYVSSTGWAYWFLEETQNRNLQYFEIILNGESVGQTVNTYIQMDINNLSEGDTCLTQVRPVYLSDTCEWKSFTWIYHPCSDYIGSPAITWTLHNDGIQLSWEYPEGDFLGAILFRNGEHLGFTEENNFMDVTVEFQGEVEYCIRLVHNGGMDGTYYSMSCETCVLVVFPAYCDPPVKLDGTTYYESENDHGVLISWGERPEPINHWLYYDNGVFKRSLGGNDEPRIFWAIRFEEEDLANHIGTYLRKVSLYDVGAGTYQLWIYVGGDAAPRTLVRSQNMSLTNAHTWHEEQISPPFEILENEPIWIVIGQQGLSRPAAACQDVGNANGRWVSLDGETWTDMQAFNMHYTWMLRAFVTNQNGRAIELGKDGYSLQQYNLYRSFNNTEYQKVAIIPAIDGQLYYEYRDNLADKSNDVYYSLTAFYLADNGDTCESDYAATLDDPDLHYISIDLTSADEHLESSLKLYPNPSNGAISIELKGLQKIMVYNTLGQLLLIKEANGDHLQLDFSGFENSLYWLRVMTQNEVIVKPLVISR